ncbi:type II toxin-antitoxin system VapC family toxin [Pararhizobium mangrovi]|uniref:type II toxin-antitoxin system VapC family toxin n=1 Tax=Pararhizobium mangrovi TaxID=2590452 RepID=UPI0038B29653
MTSSALYLDTNIFIAAFENNDAFAARLLDLSTASSLRARPSLVTRELTFAELMVVLLLEENDRLVELYEAIAVSNASVDIVPVNRTDLRSAAAMRASRTPLRLPGAIRLSTAIHQSCDHPMSLATGTSHYRQPVLSTCKTQEITARSSTRGLSGGHAEDVAQSPPTPCRIVKTDALP